MLLRAPLVARISSSSLRWSARESRFCVFWIRNTIRNVTIVVLVLMMSCQVSEKANAGPVMSQPRISATEAMNAYAEPTAFEALEAIR
jgi:hypothetical protein